MKSKKMKSLKFEWREYRMKTKKIKMLKFKLKNGRIKAKKIKSLKFESKEDQISNLPDSLIRHILSFLPSTKEAIRTGVLSKRWKNQWTGVPVLIFRSDEYSHDFPKFIDNTLALHDSSKIKKFILSYRIHLKDPNFDKKIRFATSKHVEDLSLNIESYFEKCVLPVFVFSINAFLVKFDVTNGSLMPKGKVIWTNLKALVLKNCWLSNQAITHLLSGCPLLESLELCSCFDVCDFLLTFNFLKRILLRGGLIRTLEICCPNLEGLYILDTKIDDEKAFHQAIQNVLSNSLLLKSLMVPCIGFCQIASNSLTGLDIEISKCDLVRVSCPKLEEVKVFGFLHDINVEFMDLPSSVCATLGFNVEPGNLTERERKNLEDIMRQLQHVEALHIRSCSIKIFADLEASRPISQLLHLKSVTIDIRSWRNQQSGIACVLRNSPMLESLVIHSDSFPVISDLYKFEENYWSSDANVFDCLVSHLKTVKIDGIMYQPRLMLYLAQFILKNARVLESLVVSLEEAMLEYYSIEGFQELFGYQSCSEHVKVELLTKT